MKKKCEKRKKWCRNLLGYCPTVSQYSGELYCDTTDFGSAVGSKSIAAWGSLGEVYFNIRECIVTEIESWLEAKCVTIQLYHD